MADSIYTAIGLMSGTSLDGLDIAACRFVLADRKWQFQILHAVTVEYPESMLQRLARAADLSGLELSKLHVDLGILHGEFVRDFLKKNPTEIDFISSHGHTIFHQPEKSLTLQIGSAPHIAAITGKTVIADFRTLDVALGGQGAPLVPIGDLLLFDQFRFCLNLGGIANISDKASALNAFDISPCNMALNYLANLAGKPYDDNGEIAHSGQVNLALLEGLNNLSYYANSGPKSLGREFFESEFLPVISRFDISIKDKLRTVCEHIAIQLQKVISPERGDKMLVTGGGAFNDFLIGRFRQLCDVDIVVPDSQVIQFKEALIFAFLGVLRLRGENNAMASVTGANSDSCGGCIYLPPNISQ